MLDDTSADVVYPSGSTNNTQQSRDPKTKPVESSYLHNVTRHK